MKKMHLRIRKLVGMKSSKKAEKDYPHGLRRLPTKMTPTRINAIVKVLSITQKKKKILDMGFGLLMHIDIDVVLGLLSYYLLDVYDLVTNRLVMDNGVMR